MPTDATGTPTSLGIPTFNVDADAPSGLGFNAAMQEIDTLIAARVAKPSGIVTGEVPVWNGTAWDRSSTTKIGLGSLTDPTTGKVIGSSGGAAAAVFPPGFEVVTTTRITDDGPTGVTATGNGDPLFSFGAATFEAVPHYFEMFVHPTSAAGNQGMAFRLHDGAAPGPLVVELNTQTPVTSPGDPVFLRYRFTPSSAGVHTYVVRWRAGVAGTYSLSNSINNLQARIVKV